MHVEQVAAGVGTPPGVRPLYVLLIASLLLVVLNHTFHTSGVVLSHLAH